MHYFVNIEYMHSLEHYWDKIKHQDKTKLIKFLLTYCMFSALFDRKSCIITMLDIFNVQNLVLQPA